jgi:hypothetical protein
MIDRNAAKCDKQSMGKKSDKVFGIYIPFDITQHIEIHSGFGNNPCF